VTPAEVAPAVIVPPLIDQLYVPPAGLVMIAVLPVEPAQTADDAEIVGVAGGAAFDVTVTESKQDALFCSLPPVCPSSQRVIVGPVAVTEPLKGTHELLLVTWTGARSMAVAHEVDAVGLHLTRHVAKAEFVRIHPAIVYVAPTAHPVMSCRTPPPPAELVFAICWYCRPPPAGGDAVWIDQTVVGLGTR
jgi:hypothetical protein